MAGVIEYILKLSSNGDSILKKIGLSAVDTSKKISGIGTSFSRTMDILRNEAVLNGIDRMKGGLDNLTVAGASLDSSMADLKAITGVTDDALKKISDSARSSAKIFGTDAAQNVESYKILLSKLSPEIAKNIPVLEAMGMNVNVLANAMEGDSVGAAKLLSKALNQMGIDSTKPKSALNAMTVMMNIMSQSAKDGSAELPQLGESLARAGAMARLSNLSFSQTATAIQILDKASLEAGEGGTALSRALTIIGQGRFMPKDTRIELQKAGIDINKLANNSLSLGERFKMLKPIMKDGALMAKLFGDDGVKAGTALLYQANNIDKMAKSFEGSNNAFVHSDIVMESFNKRLAVARNKVTDFKISMFDATKSFSPWMIVAADGVGSLASLAFGWNSLSQFMKTDTIVKATGWLSKMVSWTNLSTVATNLFTASWWSANLAVLALPLALTAIVAGLGYVVYKTEGWEKAFKSLASGFVNGGKMIVTSFKVYAKMWLEPWMTAFDNIRIGWYKTKELFGSKTATSEIKAIEQVKSERRKGIVEDGKLMALQAKEAGKGFSGAWSSLKWNSDKSVKSGIAGLGEKLGIGGDKSLETIMTGNNTGGNSGGGVNGGGNGSGSKNSTADAIATGGTKSTTVHITFKNMVEKLTVTSQTGSFSESESEIERKVTEALLRVLNMAGLNAG